MQTYYIDKYRHIGTASQINSLQQTTTPLSIRLQPSS